MAPGVGIALKAATPSIVYSILGSIRMYPNCPYLSSIWNRVACSEIVGPERRENNTDHRFTSIRKTSSPRRVTQFANRLVG